MYDNQFDTEEKPVGRSYGSYSSYGSRLNVTPNVSATEPRTYSDRAAQTTVSRPVPTKKSNNKKKSGLGTKLAVAVCCGLLFGSCAAGAFYGVAKYTGVLDAAKTIKSGVTAGSGSTDAVIDNVISPDNGSADVTAPDNSILPDADTGNDSTTTSSSGTVGYTKPTIPQYVQNGATDVSAVVAMVMPSMVSIQNTFTYTSSNLWGQHSSQQAVSSGSGIIVGINDEELLIATNHHVIDAANQIVVQFVDGKEIEGVVKGSNQAMDLAVVSVPLSSIGNDTMDSITIATLGDSDSLVVGQVAIAIGNSLGYGQSVSTGVVSAVNREIAMDGVNVSTFIQTDAAINPGNSGGALLDIYGNVIGINSNKIGGSSVEGMGYAIPISSAEPIITEIMNQKTRTKVSDAQRGYLGISGITVTDDVAAAYGMPKGVYIARIYDGTAADIAGMQQGDIITSLNGSTIESMDELQEELEYYAMGDEVTITYVTSNGSEYETREAVVTLGTR